MPLGHAAGARSQFLKTRPKGRILTCLRQSLGRTTENNFSCKLVLKNCPLASLPGANPTYIHFIYRDSCVHKRFGLFDVPTCILYLRFYINTYIHSVSAL
jgi:hypothetical protein